jgi:hypothetical protein
MYMRKEKGNENQDEPQGWLPAQVVRAFGSRRSVGCGENLKRRTTMKTKTNVKAGFRRK